jgi:hypothetical protein
VVEPSGLATPGLLPAGLRRIADLVLGADDHGEGGRRHGQGIRDVEAEGRVAAFVAADLLALHPHRRPVVDGTEVQDQPVASEVGGVGLLHRDDAAVPHDRVLGLVPDAGQPGLRWERYEDLPVERGGAVLPALGQPHSRVVVGERPGSTQVRPPVPHQVRPRIALVHLGWGGRQRGGSSR